jgi:hypothetical protein
MRLTQILIFAPSEIPSSTILAAANHGIQELMTKRNESNMDWTTQMTIDCDASKLRKDI